MNRVVIVLTLILLALSGCSGSSSNTTTLADPLDTTDPVAGTETAGADVSDTETESTDSGNANTGDTPGTDTSGDSDTGSGTDDAGGDDTDGSGGSDTSGSESADPEPEVPVSNNLPYGRAWDESPYDHDSSELSSNAPRIRTEGTANEPIRYQAIFDRERELYDYNPRFIPSLPYFDKDNLPWLYVSNMNQLGGPDPASPLHVSAITDQPTGKRLTSLTYTERVYVDRYSDSNPCTRCDSYILRLTDKGQWVSASIKAMSEEFGFDSFSQGPGSDSERRVEHIYFQDNGDAFLKAVHGVLHYREATNDWVGYPSRFINQSLMVGDGKRPPLFMTFNGDRDRYFVKQLVGNNDLSWLDFEIVHGQTLDLDRAHQPVVWEGNTLHIAAFNHSNSIQNRQPHNSAQTYVRHNMDTGETDTLFMGWTGSPSQASADNHNFPSLLIDSKGYLHFISGAHNHQVWHRRSLAPVSDAQWNNSRRSWASDTGASDKFSPGPTAPMAQFSVDSPVQSGVDYIGDPTAQYTYPRVRIDQNDTIHMALRDDVPRGPDNEESKRLLYIKGIPTGSGDYRWEDKGTLVAPNWSLFSAYQQKTAIDRSNRVYVNYLYAIQNFRSESWFDQENRVSFQTKDQCLGSTTDENCINAYDAHRTRWPDEPLGGSDSRLIQQYAHDPVLISSDDGGNSWTITTTVELLSRKQEENLSNVVGY